MAWLTGWLAGLLGPVVDALLLDGTKGGAVAAWLLQLKKPISAPFSGAALFLSSRWHSRWIPQATFLGGLNGLNPPCKLSLFTLNAIRRKCSIHHFWILFYKNFIYHFFFLFCSSYKYYSPFFQKKILLINFIVHLFNFILFIKT